MKYSKSIISIFVIILLAIIVLADPNSPSGFGNQTDITAWIGGKFGILNVTGRIVSQNDTWCNSTTCKTLSELGEVSGNLNMSENNITDVNKQTFTQGGCMCQNSTGHFLIETTCTKCLLI